MSVVVCFAAAPLAFVSPWIACVMYVLAAIMWLAPDHRDVQGLRVRGYRAVKVVPRLAVLVKETVPLRYRSVSSLML
jgi:hypothetical protein